MKYLGIDTSVNSMPYAVFDNKDLVDFGIIKIKGKYLEDKLKAGYTEIQKKIDDYDIDVVILEDVYHGVNFTSTKSTLQMLGALRMGAYEKDAVAFLVPATKWRKGVIKQTRRATMKQQAVDYANEMYDLDLMYDKKRTRTQDDMAEAIIMTEGLVWQRYTLEKVRMFSDKVQELHGEVK